MRKYGVWVSLFVLVVVAGVRISIGAGSSLDYTPVLVVAKDIAILHKTMEDRANSLAKKTAQLKKRVGALPPEFVQTNIGDIIQAGSTFVGGLKHLYSQMHQLRELMAERGMTAFDAKFTHWTAQYDATMSDARDLERSSKALRGTSDPQKLEEALVEPAQALAYLSEDLKELHTRFQVLANILEIFRQSGFKITPPESRVLGESADEHQRRTGHYGVADPNKPAKIFASHSKFALEDTNPRHAVWACEATLMDFLQGKVKGTDFGYTNTSRRPFCMRCHERRKGQHNMHWCILEHSNELIRACNVIEKTTH